MNRTLKLYNKTPHAVEYAFLPDPNAQIITTVVIQPGGMRVTYPYVDRDYLLFRYYKTITSSWSVPMLIRDYGVPVYWWKFVESGYNPMLAPAYEEVGH